MEDARFLAALPSEAGLAAPGAYAALAGDAELTAYASAASEELDAITDGLRATGEVLRAAVPDERSEVHRAWEAVAVVLQGPDGGEQAWVRAEVLDTGDGLEWSAWLSAEEDGSYELVATGWHRVEPVEDGEDASQGSLTWHSGVASTLTGASRTGTLEADYTTAEARDVRLRVRPDLLSPASAEYGLFAETGLLFPASFDLGGGPVDGVALAVHAPEGGRADGFLDSAPFTACWDAAGNGLYLGPEGTVSGYGQESDCALEALIR